MGWGGYDGFVCVFWWSWDGYFWKLGIVLNLVVWWWWLVKLSLKLVGLVLVIWIILFFLLVICCCIIVGVIIVVVNVRVVVGDEFCYGV